MKTTLKDKMDSCGQDEMVCLSCEQTIKQTNLSRHNDSLKQSDRGNRNGEMFLCLNCGHTDNADVNAGKNILNRFLTGQYGVCYKEMNDVQDCVSSF